MDYQEYKKLLIIGYVYLIFGVLGLIVGLIYGCFFPGKFSNLTFGVKAGLITILIYLILWAIFFFIFLASKRGREFQKAYTKYSRKIKY